MNAFSERARARRYLLGRTTEQENADIEARYLTDEDAIDELTAVEDDLIEGYLEGRLTADERASFERAFMTAPRRRARVETVRLLRQAAPPASQSSAPADAPAKETTAPPRSTWRPWLALAASFLIVLGGASVWRSSRQPASETVATTPTGDASATPATLGGASASASAPAAPPRVFAVALSAMAVRGGSETRPITVPTGTDRVHLDLELERGTATVTPTHAVLSTVGGAERWQGPVVVTGDNASVDIPASVVTPDDYFISLVAPDGAGGQRTWMQYALQVR